MRTLKKKTLFRTVMHFFLILGIKHDGRHGCQADHLYRLTPFV
jgi:hypothetical protein